MENPIKFNTHIAETLLKAPFKFTAKPTKYIAGFSTSTSLQLALERNRKGNVYLWVEKHNPGLPGVKIKNAEYLGKPYKAGQPRNSNLNGKNAPRLRVDRKAWYLEFSDFPSFKAFSDWYKV